MTSKCHFCVLVVSGPMYVTGIVGNCLSLFYFIRRQHKGLGNRLLMLLNVLDLLVCATSVTTAIPWYVHLSTKDETAWIFYSVSIIIYNPLFECTGFTTCLVSVTRTIKVCRPFYSIRGFWIGIVFKLYVICIYIREFILWDYAKIRPVEDTDDIMR